jgi:hypothetical protein
MSQQGYSSHYLAIAGAQALLNPHDAFGSFEDFDKVEPMAPCRSIPITPEVLAREAALQAGRDRQLSTPAQVWRDTLKLNPENLRTITRKALPGRIAPAVKAKQYVRCTSAPVRATRSCDRGCGKRIEARSKHTTCMGCRPKLSRWKTCASCPAEFYRWSPHATCRDCRAAARMQAKRICAGPGCGNGLKLNNQSGLCFKCKGNLRSRVLPMAQVLCDGGCGRLLRRGRTEGTCGRCGDVRRSSPSRQAQYRARRTARTNRRCSECGVLIKWDAKTGLCGKHAPMATRSTKLRAGSAEEFRMDRTWAALSAEAKARALAVFEANSPHVYIAQA